MQHRLSHISVFDMTATCRVCGLVKIKPRYKKTKKGLMSYRCKKKYLKMEYKRRSKKPLPHTKNKKDYCEKCGFVAVHKSQLDVDHIDGNRFNNDQSNLQTLCANCHRLKTYMNMDYVKQKKAPIP